MLALAQHSLSLNFFKFMSVSINSKKIFLPLFITYFNINGGF